MQRIFILRVEGAVENIRPFVIFLTQHIKAGIT